MEMYHKKKHTPIFYFGKAYTTQQQPTGSKPRNNNKTVSYYFCSTMFIPKNAFSRHMNKEHKTKGQFDQFFLYTECQKQRNDTDARIDSYYI